MGQQIARARKARVRIFPTGFELIEGRIADTNTPYLVKLFAEAGYLSEAGAALADNLDHLAQGLAVACGECGLAVTTGGVGAEDKDFSVEAIQTLDPGAATPYLVRFHKGEGRHVKDGIRLAVGEYQGCLLVALPGPHDEVRLAAPVLIKGIKQGWTKQALAEALAETVRAKFRHAGAADGGHHHHHPAGHASE
jgi:molybdenum cofactor synthesis domain-containing protein